MICPKCNWENADGSLFCNKCGFNLKELLDNESQGQNDSETLESNGLCEEINQPNEDMQHKPKKSNKFKIIVSVTLALLVIFGGIVGYKIYSDKKQAKEAAIIYSKYETTFLTNTYSILTETYLCETMCSSISDTWKAAISSKYSDFNTEISKLLKGWKDKGTLKEREDAKNKLELSMKELQNPPKDYEEAYKILVELYSSYTQIYSQATSPQGSLTTYNQDVNQKESDFNKLYEKLKVIKPEIESKIKK